MVVMTTSNTGATNRDEELRKQIVEMFKYGLAPTPDNATEQGGSYVDRLMNLIHQYGLEQRKAELEGLQGNIYTSEGCDEGNYQLTKYRIEQLTDLKAKETKEWITKLSLRMD